MAHEDHSRSDRATRAMGSTLQTALLLARSSTATSRGSPCSPPWSSCTRSTPAAPLPIEVKENDVEMAKQARGLFEKFMQRPRRGAVEQGGGSLSFGWLDEAPDGEGFVGSYGRVFDVIVLGRPGAGRARPSMTTIEAGLFEAGRPVLVAPPSPPQRMGENILIAWNCSTEQARTTAFAMPLLRRPVACRCSRCEGGTVPGPTGEQTRPLSAAQRRALRGRHRRPGGPQHRRGHPGACRHRSAAIC